MVSDQEHVVEMTHVEHVDGVDADVQLPKEAVSPIVIQPEATNDDNIPLVINVPSEARDTEVSTAIEEIVEERDNSNLCGKKSKYTTRKNSSKAKKQSKKDDRGAVTKDFDNVISTLDKNITTARKHKHQLAESNILVTPFVDGLIDNLIYRCDPLFDANYEDSCAKLLQIDEGNEESSNMNFDAKVDDQLQSKIDRILALTEFHGALGVQDNVHSHKLDLNSISAFVHQKREMDDLVVSKGLVDAELEETKEELSNARDEMELLQERNEELNEKVQTLKAKLQEKEEYAMRKEQEMAENYMNDLDEAQSTIEQMKKEREIEEALDRKHVADIKFTLEEEIQNNKHLSKECILLKQQLVAERKKRMSLEEHIHEMDNQNEELLSELHQRERYCVELEQTIKKVKGIKKEHKELLKINEHLNLKVLSSKEKLKHAKRERNELLFRLERLSNSLRVETTQTRMNLANEEESRIDLDDDINNELFLNRQSRRLERMHNIMSLH